jgi:hypothetical protein
LNNGERHGNSDLLKHGCWWKLLQHRSLKDIPSILWILLVGYYGIISKIGNMYDHVANPLFVCQFFLEARNDWTATPPPTATCLKTGFEHSLRWHRVHCPRLLPWQLTREVARAACQEAWVGCPGAWECQLTSMLGGFWYLYKDFGQLVFRPLLFSTQLFESLAANLHWNQQ